MPDWNPYDLQLPLPISQDLLDAIIATCREVAPEHFKDDDASYRALLLVVEFRKLDSVLANHLLTTALVPYAVTRGIECNPFDDYDDAFVKRIFGTRATRTMDDDGLDIDEVALRRLFPSAYPAPTPPEIVVETKIIREVVTQYLPAPEPPPVEQAQRHPGVVVLNVGVRAALLACGIWTIF